MMTEMKSNNGKRLVAAVAIFAMLVCALAIALPASNAAETETSTSPVISAADGYAYTGETAYEYVGDRTITGNDVLMTYDSAYDEAMAEDLMNDFARFAGALYYANNESVESITYNNVEYTWDAAGTLKGSNWVDAEGKTLVSAVSTAATALMATMQNGGTFEFTLGLSDETTVAMTYGLAAAVASIDTTYYGTLAAAFAAAENNDTIALLSNAAGAGIAGMAADAKTVTIDLGGFTYTVSKDPVGSPGTENQGFHIEKDWTLTVKNGTITSTADSGVKMLFQNYSNLTLDGVTLDGKNIPGTDAYVLSNNNGNITITGATVLDAKAGDYAFDVYGNFDTQYSGPTVTIADGFTGKINGKVIVDAGTATQNEPAVLNINGDVTIPDLNVNKFTANVATGKTLTVSESLTVSSDAVLNLAGTIEMDKDAVLNLAGTIEMDKGAVLNGTVSTESGANVATFTNLKAGADGVTLSVGSIAISGTIDASSEVVIDATAGTVTIDGTVVSESAEVGGLTITIDEAATGVTIGELTVSEGASVNVTGDVTVETSLTVAAGASVNVAGDVAADGATITNDGGMTVEGAATDLTVTGNMKVSETTDPEIGENASLIVDKLTLNEKPTYDGIVIVTGSIEYNGAGSIIIQQGISSTPEVGSIYYTGTVSGITGTGVSSVISAANPVDPDAYITNSVADIPADEENVVIVALNIDVTGLTVDNNVTVAGTASGTVAMDGGVLTVGAADGHIVGNVTFGTTDAAIEGLSITGTGAAITVTSDVASGEVTLGAPAEGADGTVVTFANGVEITGMTVTDGTDTVTLAGITAGTNGMTVSYGSVAIGGDVVIDGEAFISENSLTLVNANITGTGTIAAGEVVIEGTVTIATGVKIVVGNDAILNVAADALLDGTGTVEVSEAQDIASLGQIVIGVGGAIADTIVVDTPDSGIQVDNVDAFISALQYYDTITLVGTDNEFVFGLSADQKTRTITVSDEKRIIVPDGVTIVVEEGVTLEFINMVTVAAETVAGESGTFGMTVEDGAFLVIDNSDIFAPVEVDADALTLRNCETTIQGAYTNISAVGFGKTVTFSAEDPVLYEIALPVSGDQGVVIGTGVTDIPRILRL